MAENAAALASLIYVNARIPSRETFENSFLGAVMDFRANYKSILDDVETRLPEILRDILNLVPGGIKRSRECHPTDGGREDRSGSIITSSRSIRHVEGARRRENDEFPLRLRILTNPALSAGGCNYHVVIAKGCYREWKSSERQWQRVRRKDGTETTRKVDRNGLAGSEREIVEIVMKGERVKETDRQNEGESGIGKGEEDRV